MNNLQYWSVDSATRFVLVLSNVALLPGLLMFWFRAGHKGGAPRTRVHFIVERSFIRAWMVLTVIGFVLLEGSFQKPAGQALAVVGATTSLFGGSCWWRLRPSA